MRTNRMPRELAKVLAVGVCGCAAEIQMRNSGAKRGKRVIGYMVIGAGRELKMET